MIRFPIPITALALAIAPAVAACSGAEPDVETPPATERRARPEPLVDAGTEIAFELTDDLSAATRRTGEAFNAIVARDIKTSNALPLITTGSRARGSIILARPGNSRRPAILAIRIESLHVDGQWLPIRATAVSADLRHDSTFPANDATTTFAVGPAAVAFLDRILGPDAANGGSRSLPHEFRADLALARSGLDATLLEGSRLRLRLDAPIGRR